MAKTIDIFAEKSKIFDKLVVEQPRLLSKILVVIEKYAKMREK
jgi:hypothetical protein